MTITPETVAYWYLRLNGFLTVRQTGAGTRAASASGLLVGVRFPYRVARRDDARFVAMSNEPMPRPVFLLVEAHTGPCALTSPVLRERRGTAMETLLAEIGALGGTHAVRTGASESLRTTGLFSHASALVSLATFGSDFGEDVTSRYPAVPQFVWRDILPRLHAKITESESVAGREPWWDAEGLLLWRRALSLDAPSFTLEVSDRWELAA